MGPFLKNGGCRVGGGQFSGNSYGVPLRKFDRVISWTLIAQTIAAPTILVR